MMTPRACTAMQTVAVQVVALAWFAVHVRVRPYRLPEDNMLKTVCDFVTVCVCAFELAYLVGGDASQDAEWYTACAWVNQLFLTILTTVFVARAVFLYSKIFAEPPRIYNIDHPRRASWHRWRSWWAAASSRSS